MAQKAGASPEDKNKPQENPTPENPAQAASNAPTPAEQDLADENFQTPSKPHFIKMKEGEVISGIFSEIVQTRYGPGYKFRDLQTGAYFTLGGNRAQLDQLFAEVMENPEGFIGDTIKGHAIAIKRMENTQSGSGRKVAQFALAHLFSVCPKGCKRI